MKELSVMVKHKLLLIASCIILFIPCLYAGMFIWSYWDPYSKVNTLPIAVVDQDTGTTIEGKSVHIGKDLSHELTDSKDLDIRMMTEKQAEQGLKNNDYYVVLKIPKDFSKDAMSALDDTKKKAELEFIPNEGYNYTAASIGESALEKVKEKVAQTVTQAYVQSLLQAQKEVGTGLTQLANGGGQVKDGITSAEQGADDLHNGISKLAAGSLQFNQGIDQFNSGLQASNAGASKLVSGSSDLSQGLGELQTAGKQLVDGSKALSDHSKLLSQGTNDILNGVNTLYHKVKDGSQASQTGVNQLGQGIDHLSSQAKGLNQGVANTTESMTQTINSLQETIKNNDSLSDTERQELETQIMTLQRSVDQLSEQTTVSDDITRSASTLKQGIDQLTSGQTEILEGIGTLKSGAATLNAQTRLFSEKEGELASGMQQLQQGIVSAKSGSEQLVSGSGALSSGINELANGASQLSQSSSDLANGASQANAGSTSLANGLNQLDHGASDLSDGLNTATDKVNEKSFQVDDSADFISNPVNMHKHPFNHVAEYGPAFAPYFLSLGLYVGMFLFCSAFPLTTAFGARSGFSWFTGKLGVVLFIGILQAIILDGLILLMGIHVENVPIFLLFSILSSWCFGSILLFVNAALGTVGRFVTMGLLILQLTSAAGSFPLELLPKFFQEISPYMPMTYTVLGFKSMISAVDSSKLSLSTYSLLAFFIAGAIVSLLYYIARFKKDQKKTAEKAVASTQS
ncbi:putative membrane protein [Pullulanibacillus pueri]|nr:putative membrane protein [Pullulanibacillus pueri]